MTCATFLVSQLLNSLALTSILIPSGWIFQNLSKSSLDFVCFPFPYISFASKWPMTLTYDLPGSVRPTLRFSNIYILLGFPCSSNGKESACNAGGLGSIPGSGRSSGEGNGNPLQYSCLEKPMDRGAWRATVCGISKSWTQLKQLTLHYNL